MSKNLSVKINEFDKMNSMKDKIINSKTLNISLINKNLIRSTTNSDKQLVIISPRNETSKKNESEIINNIIKTNFNNNLNAINGNCNNLIIVENDETERNYFKSINNYEIQNEIIKDSDVQLFDKDKNVTNSMSNTERIPDSDNR
jgi:hypothetical protein